MVDCKQKLIRHTMCPIKDYRGNGEVETLIRTINERLRTNKEIVLTKDMSGLSEILFALRIAKGANHESAFEKHWGRSPKTLKSQIMKFVLENDSTVTFQESDFQDEVDSTILVRERARGSKLDGLYKKKTGKIIDQSQHTITILPKKGKEQVLSKRDVAMHRKGKRGRK